MTASRISASMAALALAAVLPGCVMTEYIPSAWVPSAWRSCGDEAAVRQADARHQEALSKPDVPAIWAGITPASRADYDRIFTLARAAAKEDLRKLPVTDEITALVIRQHYAGRVDALLNAKAESFLLERPGISPRQQWEITRVQLGRGEALVDATRGGRRQVPRRYECVNGAWSFDNIYMNKEASNAAEGLFRQGRVTRDDFVREAVNSYGTGTSRLEDFFLEQPGIERWPSRVSTSSW